MSSTTLKLEEAETLLNTNRTPVELGTKRIDGNGYVSIYTEKGWRREHTTVMEKTLGRPLVKGESVHHRNGIRSDNRKENLELWVGGIRYGQRASDIVCPHCGVPYNAVT